MVVWQNNFVLEKQKSIAVKSIFSKRGQNAVFSTKSQADHAKDWCYIWDSALEDAAVEPGF